MTAFPLRLAAATGAQLLLLSCGPHECKYQVDPPGVLVVDATSERPLCATVALEQGSYSLSRQIVPATDGSCSGSASFLSWKPRSAWASFRLRHPPRVTMMDRGR